MSTNSKNIKFFASIGVGALTIVLLLVFFGDVENPKEISVQRLQLIEKTIESYIAANGEAPGSLTELDLEQGQLVDHLGEPFIYSVDDSAITVMSYGSDKEPGGSFFKKDFFIKVYLKR